MHTPKQHGNLRGITRRRVPLSIIIWLISVGSIFLVASIALAISAWCNRDAEPLSTIDKLFPLLLILMAVSTIAIGLWHGRDWLKERKLLRHTPNEPWLLNPAWAKGEIRDNPLAKTITYICFAAVYNGMAWAAALGFYAQGARGAPLGIPILLIVCGFFLALFAGYTLLHSCRFRTSVFKMAKVPASPGGSLEGFIQTTIPPHPSNRFRLRLRSIKEERKSSQSPLRHTTLWESEQQVVQADSSQPFPRGSIPVYFAIPQDAIPTKQTRKKRVYYWELDISMKSGLINYKASFHVPVFKTTDTATAQPPHPPQ